jgi:hypothetical protein
LDSVYAAGEWRFFFRTQTEAGSCYVRDGDATTKATIDTPHSISVENVQGGTTDSRHGSKNWHFGVSDVSGSLPEWSDTAYSVATALLGYWNPYLGALFTAQGIISTLRHPDEDGVNSDGIFYDWNGYGVESVNHLLKWESTYPPEQGVEHSVRLTENIADVPDGRVSGETSTYTASWDIYLGSMLEPTSMSNSQIKEYGIEKVDTSNPQSPMPAEISSMDGPVYRAKNPQVRIEMNEASTASPAGNDKKGNGNNGGSNGKKKGHNK